MKSLRNARIVVMLAFCGATFALAQSRHDTRDGSDVRIVSSFVGIGDPVPKTCREEAHTFAQTLFRFPRPSNWHWVLECDEGAWQRFMRLSGRGERDDIDASTDLAGRTTHIRGSKLLFPHDLNAEPARIVAHELAHIRLNDSSEARAGELERRWLDRENTSAP